MNAPTASTEERAPDFRVEFPRGTYRETLEHYFEARGWALPMAFRHDVCGRLQTRHPDFAGGSTIPDELLEDPQWQTTVLIWVADHNAADYIRGCELPAGALLMEVKK